MNIKKNQEFDKKNTEKKDIDKNRQNISALS